MMPSATFRMRSPLRMGMLGRGMATPCTGFSDAPTLYLTPFGLGGRGVDLNLSDEHRQLQELARRFTDEQIVPFALQWDRDEAIDRALVPKLGEVGFLGLGIDEEYGGSGG